MVLDEYKRFNAEMFLKGRKSRLEEKKRLQGQLDALSELPSVDNKTGVRSSVPSDPTANHAAAELELINRIEDIDICEEAYEYGMSRLTEDEQKLIKGFFEPKMPIWKFVRKWENEHYMGTTSVYKERRLALEKFSSEIEKKWGLV